MITIFRRLRKSLIESGSTRRYIFYAIGEIALVVIGILIALQINNWNEQIKLKTKEQNALTEILSDLEVNINSLEYLLYDDVNNLTQGIKSLKHVLYFLEDDLAYEDSLAYHFRIIYNYPDVNLKESGYQSLSSMGMDLITETEVRSEIGKYYTYIIPLVNAARIELRDDFYKYMIEHMRTKFVSIQDGNKINGLEPVNYDELRSIPQYRQSLVMYLDVFEYYKREALTVLEESQKLQAQIKRIYR